MTTAISGRPARCLANGFTALENLPPLPDYPRPYDAGKALDAAALAQGEEGFGAQWAGMGAARARTMPAGELVATLIAQSAA
jgi:nitronate monooxygenase